MVGSVQHVERHVASHTLHLTLALMRRCQRPHTVNLPLCIPLIKPPCTEPLHLGEVDTTRHDEDGIGRIVKTPSKSLHLP